MKLLFLPLLLILAACERPDPCLNGGPGGVRATQEEYDACWEKRNAEHAEWQKEVCKPKKITQSPDGVILWYVGSDCDGVRYRGVYFSSRGTRAEHREGTAKTRRTVIDEVPNAD